MQQLLRLGVMDDRALQNPLRSNGREMTVVSPA